MFTFGECLNEVNLHEGEIVVDVDRGRLFYADETGMLIPTEDEEESGHVALSKLDRCALSHHLEKILEKYRTDKNNLNEKKKKNNSNNNQNRTKEKNDYLNVGEEGDREHDKEKKEDDKEADERKEGSVNSNVNSNVKSNLAEEELLSNFDNDGK